jgi:hypothetical protein
MTYPAIKLLKLLYIHELTLIEKNRFAFKTMNLSICLNYTENFVL